MKKEEIVTKFLISKFVSYGLHLGSIKSFWNPKTKVFLTGIRNNFCIFDLNLTFLYMRRAVKVLCQIIFAKKKILFVGSPQGVEKEFFSLCLKYNQYYVDKWRYGLVTNFHKISSTKSKEFPVMEEKPALLVIFDLSKNSIGKDEFFRLDIPIMAFPNSHDNFSGIDYPVPCNIKTWKGGLFLLNFFYHLFSLNDKKIQLKFRAEKHPYF